MSRLGPTALPQVFINIKNWVESKLSTKADTAHTHTAYAVKHTYTTAASAAKNWYRIANANTKQVYTGNPIHVEFILTAYNSSYDPGYSERWYVRAMVLGRNAHVIIFGSNTAPFNQCRVLYENTIADIDDNDRPAIDIYLNYVLANGTTKIEIEEVYNQGWTFVADGQLAVSTVPTGFENTAVSVRGNGVERSTYSDIATYLNKPRRDITSDVTLADNTTYRSTTLNCTGNRTITLPSINSAYFWCVIKNFNSEAGIITIHPSTTAVLIDGSNDDIILRPGEFVAIHSRAANSFSIVGDNRKRTCLVGRSGEVGTDTKHWFRVAQKTLNTRYRDAFILLDVFQIGADSTYMGRLCAHVRVDNTIGVVGNKQFTWLYRGTQLSDDDFAMTTIETSGTSLVVDIWCKRAGSYSAFAFAVVSEGFSTDSLDSPYGKWILTRERATVGDLESLDTGFTTVTNPTVVTLANSITGNAGSATTAQQVRKDPAAGSTADLLYSQCAGTDIFRLQVGGASNAGYAEIATADDGSEPIYVRQYKGTFTSLQRTATLLDGSGNTSFPGQVTGNKFDGPLTWSGTAFSYNAGNSLYYYSGQPAIANCFEGSSNDFTKFSYPTGGTSVSSSNANIQTLRLDWGNTYWHDLFMSPNNNYLWHRNVVNSDARGWRRIVEENVTGLTDQSWNINIAGNASSATEFSATTTVALTGDATGTSAGSKKGWSVPVTLANSGVTAGSYGPSTAVSPAHGGTFSVPYVTVDAKGRVTAASSITITLPSDSNTDTLMTQNVSTTDNTYPILLCATANATSNQGAKTGIFGSGVKVNPKTSVVSAKGFSGVPTGTMYVTAVKDGGALVNSQATAWGAIWRAPTKDYQVAGATWSNTNNNVYICYSVTNADVEAGTNTMAKSLIWAADTGTLTTTTFSGALSGNASTATEFSANKDVTLTGDVTGTASSKAGWSVATTLANSGVTAGTYGPSADVTGNNNATISVPEITVDAKGRVTSVTNRTLTCKNNTYNVYDKTLTIQKNGTNVATFTSNSNTDVTANITVPTKVSELTNDSGYLTSHQSLSNYVTLNTAQEITNTKTFKDANTVTKRTDIEAGNTLPSADKLARNIFQDKNGKELGSIYYYKNTSGNTGLCLRAGDWFSESEGVYSLNASGTNRRAELVLYTNSSGDCCIQPNGYFSTTLKALSTSVWLGESTKPFGRVYADNFKSCNAGLLPDTDVQTTEEHSIGFYGQNNTPLSYITFQKRPNLKDRVAIRVQTSSSAYKSYDFDATCFYPESNNSVDIGSTTNIFKNIYCNNYYKGTTAFGDIVTHNASEFLTSHQSLSSCVKNSVNNSQTIKSTAITRGTAPSSTQTFGIPFTDNNNKYIGNIYGQYATDKSTYVGLYAYKGTTTANNDNASVRVGYDASGNAYTYAPTPATADNSTQIATTAFVKAQGYLTSHQSLANYVTLDGNQTISGTKTFSSTITGSVSGNAGTATQFSANTTVVLTGDATGTSAGSKKGWSVPVTLANSGVTAGTYGPSADASPAHSGTFTVPSITVDAKGRITAASTKTITLPADNNTDTKVTQTVTTGNSAYPVLLCATANATATGTTTSRFSAGLTVNTRYSSIYMTNKYDTANTKGVRNTSSSPTNGVLYFRSYDETQMGTIRCESSKNGYQQIYMMANNYIKNGAIDPEGTNTTCYITVRVRDNGSKTIYTDGSWENSLIPYANKTHSLGTSSLQWKNAYAVNFYENGTALSSKYAQVDNISANGIGTTCLLAYFPEGTTDLSLVTGQTKPGTSLCVVYWRLESTTSITPAVSGDIYTATNASLVVNRGHTETGTWKLLHAMSQGVTQHAMIGVWVRIL